MNSALPSQPPGAPNKRKEIYKYEAPWCVYSMNWSIRPDKRFRLALGSFVEEYNNKVCTDLLLEKYRSSIAFCPYHSILIFIIKDS